MCYPCLTGLQILIPRVKHLSRKVFQPASDHVSLGGRLLRTVIRSRYDPNTDVASFGAMIAMAGLNDHFHRNTHATPLRSKSSCQSTETFSHC